MSGRLATAASLALTGVLTACGSSGSAGAPSPAESTPASRPAPSATFTPAANPIASAVSATITPGAARVDVTILTTVGGVDDEITGTGTVAFNTGDADLAWQSTAGPSREITAGGAAYVQTQPPDGDWIPVPEGTWIPTLAAGQPLAGLDRLREVGADGVEVLGAASTTRYTGSLPAPGNLGGLGINELAAEAVNGDPAARIEVTVWVDDADRIVRIMRTLRTSIDVAASSSTDLRDFGIATQITEPTPA